jgi:hypothetical protein
MRPSGVGRGGRLGLWGVRCQHPVAAGRGRPPPAHRSYRPPSRRPPRRRANRPACAGGDRPQGPRRRLGEPGAPPVLPAPVGAPSPLPPQEDPASRVGDHAAAAHLIPPRASRADLGAPTRLLLSYRPIQPAAVACHAAPPPPRLRTPTPTPRPRTPGDVMRTGAPPPAPSRSRPPRRGKGPGTNRSRATAGSYTPPDRLRGSGS